MLKKIIKIYATAKAEADIKAKNKQAKKEDAEKEKERVRERDESFSCPYCFTHHTSMEYYRGKTKKEDLEDGSSYVNFMICKNRKDCKEIFGVTTIYDFNDTMRFSFKLKDKE